MDLVIGQVVAGGKHLAVIEDVQRGLEVATQKTVDTQVEDVVWVVIYVWSNICVEYNMCRVVCA